MFVIYAEDVGVLARIERVLPRDTPAVPAANWDEFSRSATGATCLIFAVLKPETSQLPTVLERLCAREPNVCVIAVIGRNPESARAFHRVRLASLLWLEEIEQKLATAVNAVRRPALRQLIIESVLPPAGIPERLRVAVDLLASASPPPVSVKEMSVACGHHRSTLVRHWRRVAPRIRLEDFLGLLTIAYAVTQRCAGETPNSIAAQLGINPRTLQRITLRLSGLPLRTLATQTHRDIVSRLVNDSGDRGRDGDAWSRQDNNLAFLQQNVPPDVDLPIDGRVCRGR